MKNKLILVIIAVALFCSCSKDRIELKTQLNQYNSPNAYLDSKKQAEQEFIIDGSPGPIVGNQGTTIWGGKDCVRMPNGDTVSYPFSLKLVELYSPADMIYYQMPTVSSNQIMHSEGEIRIRTFKNGTELHLLQGCGGYMVSMPNNAPQTNTMRKFYGFTNGNYVDWTDDLSILGITASQSPFWGIDTIGYNSIIERFGWLNCAQLAGTTNGSTLTFASNVDDLTNVALFAYIPATKTVLQAYNQSMGIIPNGSNVKIIAIAVDANGGLFSFNQQLVVNNSQTIQVSMSSTTDAQLTALLNSL
ncbi:MAG: hypothetical protein ACKOX3_10110 [Bacteroidota bacterium]